MKKTNFLIVVVFALVLPSFAQALVTEGTEYPLYTPIDTEFANSHGALFSSNMPFVTFGVNGGVTGIFGTDPSGYFTSSYAAFYAPIIVTFVNPTDGSTPAIVDGTISAVWGDGGGDVDYLRLRAYDLSGSLLGTVNSSGTTWQSISFTGAGINQVIFDQQPGAPVSSDTFLANLSFPEPVFIPLPSAAILSGIGIGCIGWLRRRKAL